jgi:hypothetical protein
MEKDPGGWDSDPGLLLSKRIPRGGPMTPQD